VKQNEILTEVAPSMINIQQQFREVLVTSISSKKSKKTKEPKSRERECYENE
jgi:hypothetical protein